MLRQLLEKLPNPKEIPSLAELKLTEEQKTIVAQIVEGHFPQQPEPADMKEYKTFKPDLYQALFPYLALAHSFAKNGVVEEQTKKLAVIFDSVDEALKYLKSYDDQNKNNPQFVHDACLFQLPVVKPESFKAWRTVAKKNLLDKTFLPVLGLSADIDAQIHKDKKNSTVLELEVFNRRFGEEEKGPEISEDQYNRLQVELKNQISERNKFCRAFTARHHEMRQDEKKVEKNQRYLVELNELYNDRAILHLRKKIGQYGVNDFKDVYKRVLKFSDPAKEIFIRNGIAEKYYEIFNTLDRGEAGKNIPVIGDIKGILDCGDGFYMKKLNVSNRDEGALAACLGKLTDCCQSLSGEEGEPCVRHGLTNPNSGFYVLFKGDPAQPKLTDTVYGQTWVNRTASGMLLFDSIESAQGKKDEKDCSIVRTAFQNLASHLVHQHLVPRVQCGASSGISTDTGFESGYRFSDEPPLDYQGYRDSDQQLLIADSRLLMQFNEKNELEIDVKAVHVKLNEDKIELPEKIRFTVGFLLQNNLPLEPLLDCVLAKDKERTEKYIKTQIAYFEALEKYTPHSRNIEEFKEIEEYLLDMVKSHTIDLELQQDNSTLLMSVATIGNIELVRALMEAKAAINSQNQEGETPLFMATTAGNIDMVRALLEAKAAVDIQNQSVTPLFMATTAGNIDMVRALLEAKAAINSQNPKGERETALIKATKADHIEIVRVLLDAKAAVDIQDIWGNTALMRATTEGNNIEILRALLEAKAATDIQSNKMETALMKATSAGEIDMVRALLEAKALAIDIQDRFGETALMNATSAGEIDIVRALLEAKASIDIQSHIGETALMQAAFSDNIEIVMLLLESKATIDKDSLLKFTASSGVNTESTLLLLNIVEARENELKNFQRPMVAYTHNIAGQIKSLEEKVKILDESKEKNKIEELKKSIQHLADFKNVTEYTYTLFQGQKKPKEECIAILEHTAQTLKQQEEKRLLSNIGFFGNHTDSTANIIKEFEEYITTLKK